MKIRDLGLDIRAGYPKSGIRDWISRPDIWDWISGIEFSGSGIQERISGIGYPGLDIRDQVSGIGYLGSDIRDQISRIGYPGSGIWYSLHMYICKYDVQCTYINEMNTCFITFNFL